MSMLLHNRESGMLMSNRVLTTKNTPYLVPGSKDKPKPKKEKEKPNGRAPA